MAKSREDLLLSQSILNVLSDNIPQTISVRNSNGAFIYVNKNFAELFGMEPADIIAKTYDEILPPHNDPESIKSFQRQALEAQEPVLLQEAAFTDVNGIARKYQSTQVPFLLADNEKAVLGVSLAITEQLKVDAERKKIIAEIMQRNNALEQFSYIISHNLRAPIANILGIKEALETRENSDEEKEYF